MKRYEFTGKGKFTVTLLAFAVLVCVVAGISRLYADSPSASPSPSPSSSQNSPEQLKNPSPSSEPASPSAEPSDPPSASPALEPIPVSTPSPQATPSPSDSWSSKSLALTFSESSAELSPLMSSALSQFLGNSPDLTGWIMVIEGQAKSNEDAAVLRMERANSVGSYVMNEYGLSSDMVLPIMGDGSQDAARADIYFIVSGPK